MLYKNFFIKHSIFCHLIIAQTNFLTNAWFKLWFSSLKKKFFGKKILLWKKNYSLACLCSGPTFNKSSNTLSLPNLSVCRSVFLLCEAQCYFCAFSSPVAIITVIFARAMLSVNCMSSFVMLFVCLSFCLRFFSFSSLSWTFFYARPSQVLDFKIEN